MTLRQNLSGFFTVETAVNLTIIVYHSGQRGVAMRAESIAAIQLIISVSTFSLMPKPTLSVMSIAMSLFFVSLPH